MNKLVFLLNSYSNACRRVNAAFYWGISEEGRTGKRDWFRRRLLRKGVTKDDLSRLDFFSGTIDGFNAATPDEARDVIGAIARQKEVNYVK